MFFQALWGGYEKSKLNSKRAVAVTGEASVNWQVKDGQMTGESFELACLRRLRRLNVGLDTAFLRCDVYLLPQF